MKPLYYRSVSSKGAGRPRLTHHHKGGWNETKLMKWEWRNGGMKFVVGENGRNPEETLPRPRFVHHETHMEWPRRELGTPAVGGERLTACATRPPCLSKLLKLLISPKPIDQLDWIFNAFYFQNLTYTYLGLKYENYKIQAINVAVWKLDKTQCQFPLSIIIVWGGGECRQ